MKMYIYKYWRHSGELQKRSFNIKKIYVYEEILFKYDGEFGESLDTTNIISYMTDRIFSVRELTDREEKEFIKHMERH